MTGLPANARLLHSAQTVAAAVADMAAAVAADIADRDPIVLAVMNGGVFTAVALSRHFEFPYEFDYVHVTRYRGEMHGGDLHWLVRPRAELAGRCVLVVDDVLDRGVTLDALHRELRAAGATDLRSAVLVDKQLEDAPERPHVEYRALTAGSEYIFGCGMDLAGRWRGLPALYVLEGNEPDSREQ